MSSTTLTIVDSNLLSGSTDDFRTVFGGLYISDASTVSYLDSQILSLQPPSLQLVENEGILTSNRRIQLSNYSLTSRISSNDQEFFLNDQLWRDYIVQNFDNSAVFVDHKTQITVPVYQYESPDADAYTSYAKSEYYKYYDRYQNSISDNRSYYCPTITF
jgi:hypothetical protein